MGAPDWDTVVASRRPDRPPMTRDMDVEDGQTLTLGDTTVTFALTPGHTPGTIAAARSGSDGTCRSCWSADARD